MTVRLRPVRLADEAAFRLAHAAMAADGFVFGLGLEPEMSWPDYLHRLESWRTGFELPPGVVPSTFLVADVDGVLVGRSSIRHELTDFLAREGGHIGFGVVAEHRRRGHATDVLRQSLVIARSIGVERVLVTCDDDNVGSATVIERCGGAFDSVVEGSRGGPPIRRYWID